MAADDVLTLAALGRPFGLGMLYDKRKESLVPGVTLWDPEQLKEFVTEKRQAGSQYDIIRTDSMEEKASSLGVEASLKLSLLGGMVSTGGSAKFLSDRKSKSSQSRVSLKYSSTSHFRELTMKHLCSCNILHPEIFGKNIATHVVIGILYGAQSFFVFDRDISETENQLKIQVDLQAMIKSIPGKTIDGKGSLDMNFKDKSLANKLSCRFYGDVRLQTNPTTYEEAVKIYQELPKYIGEHGENAVPTDVWLYPLSKLDSKAQPLVRDISTDVIKQFEDNLEYLQEFVAQCNDLLSRNTCKCIPEIKNRIEKFTSLVTANRQRLQIKLADILPKVRGFRLEENELLSLLQNHSNSPFNTKLLKCWIKERKEETNVLDAYVKSLQEIYRSNNEGDITAKSFEHDYVLLLRVVLPLQEDNLLHQMSECNRADANLYTRTSAAQQWFKDENTTIDMRKMLKSFTGFVEENKDCSELFTMVSISEEKTHVNKCAYIIFYENGIAVHKNFIPPYRPGKPSKIDVSNDAITIQWEKPQVGSEFVDHYDISYRVFGDENWKVSSTQDSTQSYRVKGLEEKTGYEFRVRAVCLKGHCPYGDISDEITTKEITKTHDAKMANLERAEGLQCQKLGIIESIKKFLGYLYKWMTPLIKLLPIG